MAPSRPPQPSWGPGIEMIILITLHRPNWREIIVLSDTGLRPIILPALLSFTLTHISDPETNSLTFSRSLEPGHWPGISVMTVTSVWNLIKDSSYLYWHSLPASHWTMGELAGLWLAGIGYLWHLWPHCVTLGGAIWNKIMTVLDSGLVTRSFYLQFYYHCLPDTEPGAGASTHRGHRDITEHVDRRSEAW